MFHHYLKIAFRNLWKYKGQNLIGIIGLAIGFACFSLCSYLAQEYFTQDTEYPDAGRMYKLSTKHSSVFNGDIYTALKAFPEVEKVSILETKTGSILFFNDKEHPRSTSIYLLQVDTCFIDFFSLKILAGNTHSINRTANSIVLFEDKAKELSENSNELIGKTVKLFNDETEYQIVGIVKKPRNSAVMSSYFFNGFILNKDNSYLHHEVREVWDPQRTEHTFLLLNTGSSFSDFQKRLLATNFGFKIDPNRLGYTIQPDGNLVRNTAEDKEEHFTLLPINKINKSGDETRIHIGIFVIGLLVFLMALFNYMSFQTALFYNRLKECAIRKANGSGKTQIFLLFFSEILIAFLSAFLIALLLIQTLSPQLKETPLFYTLQPEVLKIYMVQYLLYVVLLSAVFCLIPTYTINKLSIRTVFLGLSVKGKKTIGRDVLLFIQMVILLLFISSSSIVSFQTYRLKSGLLENVPKNEQKRIFSIGVSKELLEENIHSVMQQLSSSPLYEDVLLGCDNVISTIGAASQFKLSLNGEEQNQWIGQRPVPVNFFNFFHCQLIKGQLFDENTAPNDIVIDKTFADLFDSEEVLGKIIGEYRVIGVINTLETATKKDQLSKTKSPTIYLNQETETDIYSYVLYVKLLKGKEKEARKFMESVLKKVLPEHITVNAHSLDEEINSQLTYENTLFYSLTLLFIISLIIGLLSIYSAVAMNTEKRRKEVAIRKINGAGLYEIILLFFRKYLIMWTVICVIAFPLVYHYANSWLENYIDRISLNIFLFIGIYLLVLVLIVLTIIGQILEVARTNPADVIKSE